MRRLAVFGLLGLLSCKESNQTTDLTIQEPIDGIGVDALNEAIFDIRRRDLDQDGTIDNELLSIIVTSGPGGCEKLRSGELFPNSVPSEIVALVGVNKRPDPPLATGDSFTTKIDPSFVSTVFAGLEAGDGTQFVLAAFTDNRENNSNTLTIEELVEDELLKVSFDATLAVKVINFETFQEVELIDVPMGGFINATFCDDVIPEE